MPRAHGWDFDGVALKNDGELRAHAARELFGRDLPGHLFHRHRVVEAGELSREEYDACIGHAADNPDYLDHYEPMLGFPEVVLRLLDDGDSVVFVTMRREFGVRNAESFARRLGVPEEVSFVGTGEVGSKLSFVGGLDTFLDDRAKNLEEMVAVPHRFLMAEERVACEYAHVVCSLQEYYEAICEIAD